MKMPVSRAEIPESVVLRWMMKAAVFGLFVGAWVAVAALRAG
jgi:hypothetical protein